MTNRQSSTPTPCMKARDLVLSLMEVDTPLEATSSGAAAIAPTGLTSAEQTFLNEHLFSCVACRVYQSDMQLLAESFDALDDVPVPDGLADRIMARIDFGAAASDATETPLADTQSSESKIAPKATGPEKHLHGVPNTAASASDSLPRIGGAPSATQGRPFTRLMAPIAAPVLLLALAAPQVTHWLQPGSTSGSQEVARTTTPTNNPANGTGMASNATNNQIASLPNAISASQTPVPTAKGSGQSNANNTVVALVPKPISPKGTVTGSNTRSTPTTKAPAKAPTATPKKPQPAATKPQTVSKVVIASVPHTRSTQRVTNNSVDGQELAYDPVSHLFGSNWAVDEFGNAVSSADVSASSHSASDELATSTTHAPDTADDSDNEDPVSSLVGF